MKQYRITITVHREAESSEDAVVEAIAEFLPCRSNSSILAQNVDNPCDCTFIGPDKTRGVAA